MSKYRFLSGGCPVVAFLAASLLLAQTPLAAFAGPGDVNSINDGQIIQNGEYFNTPDSHTEFVNSAGTGLFLQAGDLVKGTEVTDAVTMTPTGNGGSLFFNAPGQIVRLDGNVDVSGFNGGNVVINSAFLYQNGQIFANGANGGNVVMNVTGMTSLGPNAKIEAIGTNGASGQVQINSNGAVNVARGAIIDASGTVIGSFNTNVIQIQGGLVNLDGVVTANGFEVGQSVGFAAGQSGGVVQVSASGNSTSAPSEANLIASGIFDAAEAADIAATDTALRSSMDGNVRVGADGRISANGADGFTGDLNGDAVTLDGGTGGLVKISAAGFVENNGHISADGGNGFTGYSPTNGGHGGAINIAVQRDLNNAGRITANGGHGGTNPDAAVGPVVDQQQTSLGQDGGHGGNGGGIVINYGGSVNNTGSFEVAGGNGGEGQLALAEDAYAEYQTAIGGNGGNGGNGGLVEMIGGVGAKLPSQQTLNNIDVSGGSGGKGGGANTLKACGCEKPGSNGACGVPGQIVYRVDDIPPPPPPPPVFPPYPKENPRLGEALPPGIGPVLSYNRSIFLARAPLPIIQKRQPKPTFQQIVSAPVAPPPPAPPPQKKVTVRGYW